MECQNEKVYKHKVRSAGGIVIDPWNNIYNPEKYNVLIIKQRIGNNWGLPKGHCEQGEDLEKCALREIREETGIDFRELHEGYDYLKINFRDKHNNIHHKKNIKKISFFMYVLLRKGNHIPKYKRDYTEIKELTWINTSRLRKLCTQKNPNFKCNRTLSVNSSIILKNVCDSAYKKLYEYQYI